MSIKQTKDFLDTDQLVKDPCCPFSKRALYWHIWRPGINGPVPPIYRVMHLISAINMLIFSCILWVSCTKIVPRWK